MNELTRLDAHLATYPDRPPELIYDEDGSPKRQMAGRPGPRRRRPLRRQTRATSHPRNRIDRMMREFPELTR